MADVRGQIVIILTQVSGAMINVGQAIDTANVYMETKDLDAGDPTVRKTIQRIVSSIPLLRSSALLTLEVKIRDALEDALVSASSQLLTQDDLHMRIKQSKYFRLRYSDNGVQVRWRLGKIEVHGGVGGRRF